MLIIVRKLESLDTFSIFVIFQQAFQFCSRERKRKEKGKGEEGIENDRARN